MSLNGRVVGTIEQDGPDGADRFIAGARDLITGTAKGFLSVSNSDPSFIFTQTARAVKPLVLLGMPPGVAGIMNHYFTPMVRVVDVLMDVKKWAARRHKSKLARQNHRFGPFDTVGTVVDGGHLLTDAAGVAGAVGRMVAPGSALFSGLLTLAFATDIAVYSYHALEYIHDLGASGGGSAAGPIN